MRILGILFLLAGLGLLGYFFLSFDTSVASEGGDLLSGGSGRTNNLGLMNDRVCGCIVGAALSITGAIMGGYPSESANKTKS